MQSRSAKTALSPKLLKHFAAATVVLTALLAVLVSGADWGAQAQVDAVVTRVREELGAPAVVVHNAVGGAFGNFLDIDPKMLMDNF